MHLEFDFILKLTHQLIFVWIYSNTNQFIFNLFLTIRSIQKPCYNIITFVVKNIKIYLKNI